MGSRTAFPPRTNVLHLALAHHWYKLGRAKSALRGSFGEASFPSDRHANLGLDFSVGKRSTALTAEVDISPCYQRPPRCPPLEATPTDRMADSIRHICRQTSGQQKPSAASSNISTCKPNPSAATSAYLTLLTCKGCITRRCNQQSHPRPAGKRCGMREQSIGSLAWELAWLPR